MTRLQILYTILACLVIVMILIIAPMTPEEARRAEPFFLCTFVPAGGSLAMLIFSEEGKDRE